jgi:ribosome biogenesis protein NSA1
LTYHPSSSSSTQSRTLSAPVTCLATASSSSTSFAIAGNGLEVSIWDLERTFASSGEKEESMSAGSKRKKELEEGETWRAKNVGGLSESAV